jgi:hypothetical protein
MLAYYKSLRPSTDDVQRLIARCPFAAKNEHLLEQ